MNALNRLLVVPALATLAVLAGASPVPDGSSCQPSWTPTFGGLPGVNGTVLDMVVFDDGSGPALFLGGTFSSAGGVPAGALVKWDGAQWTEVGGGVAQSAGDWVSALEVWDDGSGPALFVGGNFALAGGLPAENIAKWDGTSWSVLGAGVSSVVQDFVVFDDGGGPALFAAGHFVNAGGAPASRIARWDGAAWNTLGAGANGPIWALAVHDAGLGGGPELFAGGDFTAAGGVISPHLAKWNGTAWSSPGALLDTTVWALSSFDDGAGPALFVGGSFTTAGGMSAGGIARWDGTTWSALGGGLTGSPGTRATALYGHDDGSGPVLLVGGDFDFAGGVSAPGVAQWDGSAWAPLGAGTNSTVYEFAEFDAGLGAGSELFVGGGFSLAGSEPALRIATWDGSDWAALGGGLNGTVRGMTVHDDGSGPALFVGGEFSHVDGLLANGIAAWDGSQWATLGGGVGGTQSPFVWALQSFDDGTGPGLFVGGVFTTAGGVPANYIAKWDGTSWSALGTGMFNAGPLAVYSLTVFDDGNGGGPELYAGGDFKTADGVATNFIGKWNGTNWSAVGGGVKGTVLAMQVHDDGGGPALFAAGWFETAGTSVPAKYIAKWDGTVWTALGSGLSSAGRSLAVHDDGTGSGFELIVGGATVMGGIAVNGVGKWDGTSWSALGSGPSSWGQSLLSHDDGNGPALYSVGGITSGGPFGTVERWDGVTWTALGSSPDDIVWSLAQFDDGSGTGPALYAGGEFTTQPDSGDSYLSRWGGCAAFETYCTAGTSAAGCQALISAVGVPSASESLGFSVQASGVDGGLAGLFFFGTNGRQASPWGNGTSLQCVVPPVQRASLITSTGPASGCAASFAEDLNALWCPSCPKPGVNPGAGAVVQAGLWYRDPQNTSNQTTSLSDAIEFTLAP